MNLHVQSLKSTSEPTNRGAFIANVPRDGLILEIGPFDAPSFTGDDVRYFDILSADEIRAEAVRLGRDPSATPQVVHYLQRQTQLKDIPERFSAVYSSHCIEHTLDAIEHINMVSEILSPGGKYFLVVPDKRYCFDHYKNTSTIGGVIEAHESRRTDYPLRLWIDRATRSTHNDPARHWRGDHGTLDSSRFTERVASAIKEYKSGYRLPMMPHMWCFTPAVFLDIFTVVHELGYTRLKLSHVHETRQNSLEFYAVFVRP